MTEAEEEKAKIITAILYSHVDPTKSSIGEIEIEDIVAEIIENT